MKWPLFMLHVFMSHPGTSAMTEILHPPPEDKRHFPPMPPMTAPLWFGVLTGPALWGVQLQLTYMLVPWICQHQNRHFLLHVVTLVCAALAALCALLCWRYLHPPGRVGDESPSSPP